LANDAAIAFPNVSSIAPHGYLSLLAADHRKSMRSAMNPERPDSVKAAKLEQLKLDICKCLSHLASATVIDADFAKAAKKSKVVSEAGLLMALEKSGYSEHEGERYSSLQIEPRDAMKLGAEGAKLQLHYNPRYQFAAERQISMLKHAKKECAMVGLPLFLQIHLYEVPNDLRERALLECAKTLGPHCDVLLCELPSNTIIQDSAVENCAKFTDALRGKPWGLLGHGDDYLAFLWKLETACRGGASGFCSGMAIWREAAHLQRTERVRFLNVVASGRLIRANNLARRYARKI
jgi:tagatose 1,6-diphosphate aldolase